VLVYRAARDPLGPRRTGQGAHLRAAGAAVLLVAAFFTKQTAGPFMAFAALALALLNWRLVPTFVLALAAVGLPSLWWLDRQSGGWFWRYVYQLHQSHAFYPQRAWLKTPGDLAGLVGPAALLLPWALLRRRSAALAYATGMALAGVAVACLAFGTQWAHINAYIPGVFFPSLAIGVAAGRLAATLPDGIATTANRITLRVERQPRFRPALAFLLLGASLALHRFDPRAFVPTAEDREAGRRLVERLRAVAGEVLIPFHPWYGHLAGKRTWVHQMGLMDVYGAFGRPAGLVEAIRDHRFQLVVVDDKIADKWTYWPGLEEYYEVQGPVPGPRVVSGAMTHPTLALVPRAPVAPAAAAADEGADASATEIDREIQ
jgi:hypothetical protein